MANFQMEGKKKFENNLILRLLLRKRGTSEKTDLKTNK